MKNKSQKKTNNYSTTRLLTKKEPEIIRKMKKPLKQGKKKRECCRLNSVVCEPSKQWKMLRESFKNVKR